MVGDDIREVLRAKLAAGGYTTGTDAFSVKSPRKLIKLMQAVRDADMHLE